ncbi:phosphoribosyltransferase family protein [Bacillus sp. D386]|uniref:phosphoribosyltransferase family protein n=1 Tax=Bacillus sp. D386 TaxID=2587155 RepID=UPI00111F7EF5|nr:phosphoribosyltransferase family protein [Bacillus sp. D386]
MTATRVNIREVTHQILDDLTVGIEVFHNPYDFETNQLFKMATRINKKRNFLFVSTVLGKHLAVNPKIPLLVGHLLSLRYLEVVYGKKDMRAEAIAEAIKTGGNIEEALLLVEEDPIKLPKPLTIIGFAETATALGHAVFSSFDKHAKYIHTTREKIAEIPSIINFEEEHSHASSHYVYSSDPAFFDNDQEIVLVDDEITTGKTAINIIRKINSVYPSKKVFTLISILDWRTAEHRAQYQQIEKELGITVHPVSLMDGTISINGQPDLKLEDQLAAPNQTSEQHVSYIPIHHYFKDHHFNQFTSINTDESLNASPYSQATGRFGLDIEEERSFSPIFEEIGGILKQHRKGKRTLAIGTGEFMYIPMMIASSMGSDVYFQSTTRSPIYSLEKSDYLIHNKFTFDSPENKGVVNYLYNIEINRYDEIFIFIERNSSHESLNSILSALKQTGINFITVITLTEMNQ